MQSPPPSPIEQLDILGAGFDTGAWRLDALEDATVLEVDRPSTEALKRERAAAIAAIAAKGLQVRFRAD